MGLEGEDHLRKILKEKGYEVSTPKHNGKDILAIKDNLAILIEEKDWKAPIRVKRNKIYYGFNRFMGVGQVKSYLGGVIEGFKDQNKFYHIIPCYVFSNKQGRLVDVIHDGVPVFIVARQYFRKWLTCIEGAYLGMMHLERTDYQISSPPPGGGSQH